ncbi:HD domain-containing protein [Fusibacter paucivorans]|uniref:HD domain-containing protein n=1 Tax=Fusibacter paucivorans TaxID=76009 RepID=A0ABS5PLS2_9FIRM|nr:HD domain-containing protein [Fusibacter paucivorans]
MLIKDFKVGEEVTTFFLIKAKNVKTSSANKPYIDFTFQDVTGDINAKLWDVKGDIEHIYNPGELVKVMGTVTQWQSTLQLKIIKIRNVEPEDKVDYGQFIPVAPIDPETMFNEILFYINKMTHKDFKKLTLALLEESKSRLMYYPAAKSNHHAIKSGLLYHIIRMLRTGDALCDIYHNCNRDLVLAGIILHDIEKLNEMDANELGIVGEYTKEGQLLGHIIMGIKKIEKTAEALKIDPEVSLLLQHMILAHHYEPEFGSPKKPLIPEGELLHYIDMIDARMYDMNKALKDLEAEQFTDPIFVLDRRRLYRSKFAVTDEN